MHTRLDSDDRGVSEVVGAILVFGILVALLGIIQTQAVPVANQEVEFNHNQELQEDIIDLQEAISRSGARGTSETVKLQTGTTYPSRLVFFNPSPPSGVIRTQQERNVTIENIRARGNSSARQYVNGSITGLNTKRFTYTPSYNEYDDAPTTSLGYGVIYNQFDNGEILVESEGAVVRGNQITLSFLTGNLSGSKRRATAVETVPTSAPARTITVEPDGGPIRITLPTNLSVAEWESILGDELQSNGGNVQVTNASDGVILQLDQNVTTYELRMSQVGIGPNAPIPDAEYTISPGGQFTTVQSGEPTDITFEVRDKYNNPVSGEQVEIALGSGAPVNGSLSTNTVNTDRQGRATVRYNSPGGLVTPVSLDVNASFANDPTSGNFSASGNPEDVNVRVTVIGGVSGPVPSIGTLNINSGTCDDTDTGSAGTTVLGDEATRLEVDWSAGISSNNTIEEVRVEMVDTSNNQTADSTRYQPGSSSASDTVVLRDRRRNDDSCDKDYRINVIAESDGGRTNSSSITATSGSDYSPTP